MRDRAAICGRIAALAHPLPFLVAQAFTLPPQEMALYLNQGHDAHLRCFLGQSREQPALGTPSRSHMLRLSATQPSDRILN